MSSQSTHRAPQLVLGVLLGVGCALLLKAAIWFLPLMLFVGD